MLGRIAKYELLELIGRGGMGAVFRARDSRLDKVVAVKILLDELAENGEYRERFLREARAEASLSHPCIAACFDVGEATLEPPDLLGTEGSEKPPAQRLYLTMEFVPGSDLSSMGADRPLAIPRVLDLASQIATGLEHAHAAGVIHRDLKPANVRVTPEGQVKILDFGLARIMRATPEADTQSFSTSGTRVMGTWHFMAPEQANGRTTDPRSDLFSFGVMLYRLITGKLPFTGETFVEVAKAVANENPAPMARYASDVPDELERIVQKLLAKDPDERYQSAHEVRTDLERLRHGRSRAPSRGRRALVLAFAAVIALIAGWSAYQTCTPRPPHSIAVMPFENRTGDPRLDYLGDGISAGVIASLVSATGFNVASASTVHGIATSERSAERVARELGVQNVLEGAFRIRGDATRLDVELVDGRSGFVLWTDNFSCDLESLEDVEREIVRQVARRLAGPFGSVRTASATPRPAPSHSAYERTLRAQAALDDPDDPRGADHALELLVGALEQDPDFALAWAVKSRALWKMWTRDKAQESVRMAEEAADRAIQLNPELLEARVARAQIYRATSRYDASIRELHEVLRINPNWDEAELQLAASYRQAGDLANAEARLHHAVSLRPGYWRNWNALGGTLALRGDYEGARAAYTRVVRLIPERNLGYEQLALVAILQGRYDAAITAYEKLPAPVQDGSLASNIGTAYFFERRLDDARRFYSLALKLEPRNPDAWKNMGDLDTRAGRPDSARTRYAEAVRLLEDMLHVDPKNVTLQVERALCLAKAGDCPTAKTALEGLGTTIPADNAEIAHRLAKLYAVCGRRAETLAALRRAVSLGVSAKLLLAEDEFGSLATDAQFREITAGK